MDQVVPVGVGAVDGEGAGDDPRDGHGIESVDHSLVLEDGELAALPGERSWDARHGLRGGIKDGRESRGLRDGRRWERGCTLHLVGHRAIYFARLGSGGGDHPAGAVVTFLLQV